MLTKEIAKKENYNSLCENKLSFVTFNYDRSLEHFLYESLVNSFSNVDSSALIDQLNAFPIIHVFGQIAPLPWQDQGNLPLPLKYGTSVSEINIIDRLRKNIRTIYDERTDESFNEQLEKAQYLIYNAQRVFFLGFGYAKENLELLKIPECLNIKQWIYGTALGATEKEITNITRLLNRRGHPTPVINPTIIKNCDCQALLREFL